MKTVKKVLTKVTAKVKEIGFTPTEAILGAGFLWMTGLALSALSLVDKAKIIGFTEGRIYGIGEIAANALAQLAKTTK